MPSCYLNRSSRHRRTWSMSSDQILAHPSFVPSSSSSSGIMTFFHDPATFLPSSFSHSSTRPSHHFILATFPSTSHQTFILKPTVHPRLPSHEMSTLPSWPTLRRRDELGMNDGVFRYRAHTNANLLVDL
ncbi:hypothetical protein JAAARDRAFT_529524 [Jaapia argillacea MUCL 33604]|uniref:Uncharacterized protein n=1 Tax=Jaapia argillacea MUCL 33604 TaxID=933084 RepID=A0A067QEU8_9AGAM|nr:hypothetical protein JAAARDRAFT_529524 [Jaapia argillacea MUCL 33604]